MDIVKAFNTNDLHTEVVIKGTKTDPLFRASDIGIILEINNIRMSIIDFDESEKRAVHTTDGTGRMQDITFLTEKGLYRVGCKCVTRHCTTHEDNAASKCGIHCTN